MSRRSSGGAEFIILCIVLLGLPLLFASRVLPNKKDSEMDRKKKWTNILGGVVFAIFVLAILCTKGVQWAKQKRAESIAARQLHEQQRETQDILNTYALGFSKGRKEEQLSWAKGEAKDTWGNKIILLQNNKEGTQFLSWGPDGVEGTDDDMKSALYRPSFNKRLEQIFQPKPQKEEPSEPSVLPHDEEKTNEGGWKWKLKVKWPWADSETVHEGSSSVTD